MSKIISFNQILEHHDNIAPPLKLPLFPEIATENQIKQNFNNIVKSTDNHCQGNYTIYESQYEVLMSQTRIKKRETSMDIDQSKRIEETSKTPVKLAGPCFLNMIDPFQINRRHMKLLTHRLNNNEFEDLKDKVRSISHVNLQEKNEDSGDRIQLIRQDKLHRNIHSVRRLIRNSRFENRTKKGLTKSPSPKK